jgi:hypothetical protein
MAIIPFAKLQKRVSLPVASLSSQFWGLLGCENGTVMKINPGRGDLDNPDQLSAVDARRLHNP